MAGELGRDAGSGDQPGGIAAQVRDSSGQVLEISPHSVRR